MGATKRLVGRGSLGRNAVAGAVATGVDFATVWALVAVGLVSVPVATLIGCTVGAVVNFAMNRVWTFGSDLGYGVQAVRYALVSAASALLNAGLVALALVAWEGAYQVVWVAVRVVVFVAWNYPLHRHYVFVRARPIAAPHGT